MSTASSPEFRYSDLLPTGADETPYRLVTTEGVTAVEAVVDGRSRTFLQVEPEAIRRLTAEAMHDIAHYLRPAHLAQLRRIIDDPESSGNDRFVALDLREARFTAEEVVINAVTIMGGIDIYVDAHTRVSIEGVGIMGGFEEARPKVAPDVRADAPLVRVRGLALMGAVTVQRRPPPAEKPPRRHLPSH